MANVSSRHGCLTAKFSRRVWNRPWSETDDSVMKLDGFVLSAALAIDAAAPKGMRGDFHCGPSTPRHLDVTIVDAASSIPRRLKTLLL